MNQYAFAKTLLKNHSYCIIIRDGNDAVESNGAARCHIMDVQMPNKKVISTEEIRKINGSKIFR
jgi:ACT domain-containing protein